MALHKSVETHSGSGKRTTCATKNAARLVSGTRKLAQPENPRLEELLCDTIQHKMDDEARLVHLLEADKVVRKETPA